MNAAALRQGSPPPSGPALTACGRARRFELGSGGELWRLEPASEPIAVRLLALGAVGVGGFVDGGRDEEGPWMVRTAAEPSLHAWLRAPETTHPWADVVGRVGALAERLAVCEDRSLGPGRMGPDDVSLTEGGGLDLHFMAPQLVAGLVGAVAVPGSATPGASRWVPPEVDAGAPWDNAANRYVLGLILYRGLAGAHPFAGLGLRRGLNEQAERGAPPMPDATARTLPPGLQSYCLRLLAPRRGDRPEGAAQIGDRLREFSRSFDGGAVRSHAARPAAVRTEIPLVPSAPASALPARTTGRRWGWIRAVAALLPWVGGVAIASTISLWEPEAPAPQRPSIGARPALDAAHTRADDCSTCHPRQAAQWHGSVMAHSVKSPLFQGLEMLIEEQVGRDFDCPEGAGILRRSDGATACRDRDTGIAITGSGGEHWCINCHAAGDNLATAVPAWDGVSRRSSTRRPLRDLLRPESMEGIGCAFCHQVHGPTRPGNENQGLYEGNPYWTSTQTGQRFSSRPEDRRGQPGISNSGYFLDPSEFLTSLAPLERPTVAGGAHVRPSSQARSYLQSSAFCGSCHDVRLFGTDAVGIERGEHFKRLRNAYSEWVDWAGTERAAGRQPASCQDCHMTTFPGVCVEEDGGEQALRRTFGDGATALERACPPGTIFEARKPGARPEASSSTASGATAVSTHYFTGVDVPLSAEFPPGLLDDPQLDAAGVPVGARQRRDMLLGSTFRFDLGEVRRSGRQLEIPLELENIGAGHKVPAGFSQEREFWVHLRVTDSDGRVVYEVGRVDADDEDLRDKRFVRVNVDDGLVDGNGAPQGMFGADVADGPDVPLWSPDPRQGGTVFRGRGLVNLQNGFLRCVTCIGEIDAFGRCQPRLGQGRHRADRFADGQYDLDTGECISNLQGDERFFETYFPVGALDASRGATKGPDAIIDTRSAPPGVPLRYVYELDVSNGRGPLVVEARLLFRAFPPFLIKAFAAYEALQAARGARPSGPLVGREMLRRLEVVELHRREVVVP